MTDPVPTPPAVAGPGKRLGGFVIDALVLAGLALVLVPLTGISVGDSESLLDSTAFRTSYLIMTGLYQVGFVAARGQTPGKMLVRTQVVDATTYRIPSVLAAAIRFGVPTAAGLLPGLLSLTSLLVYLWLLWDPHRQGIHDKAAHTLVIDL